MAQQLDKAGLIAQGLSLWNNNTQEEITPERNRIINDSLAESFAILNDTASISGAWEFTTNPSVPLLPTADAHAISKKYFDDNAGVASGDVVGPASSIDNTIVVYDGITGKLIKGGTGVNLSQTSDFSQVGNISFATATKTIGGIQIQNLLDKSISQAVSGGWTFSGANTISGSFNAPTSAGLTIGSLPVATEAYVLANAGVGDVVGAASSVDGGLALFDSTTGKLLKADPNISWSGTQLNVGGTLSINDLTVDNIVIDGNDISTSSGNLTFTPIGDSIFSSLITAPSGIINGGVGVTATGMFLLRQSGDTESDGLTITSSNASAHRMWKNAAGTLIFGTAANQHLALDTSGGVTFSGEIIGSSALTVFKRTDLTGELAISAGTTSSSSANIIMRGSSNASYTAQAMRFRAEGGALLLNLAANGDATIAGAIESNSTTDSTSATTGSIQTDGGLGVVKKSFFGDDMDVDGHISYQTGIDTKTDDYTILESDNGKILKMNAGSAKSFILPTTVLSDGFTVQLINISAFTTTIDRTTNTETLYWDGGTAGTTDALIEDQYTGAVLECDGTNYLAIGRLS